MVHKQYWIGNGTDEAWLLSDIVGWCVESENAERYGPAIRDAQRFGYIRTRPHLYCNGDEFRFYALTEKGFDRLLSLVGQERHDRVRDMHDWYEKTYRKNADAMLAAREKSQ